MSNTSLLNAFEQRKSLTEAREQYQYNYTYIPPLAMVDKLPSGEGFSFSWSLMVAQQVFKLLRNTITANRGDRGQQFMLNNDVKPFLRQTLQKTLVAESRKEHLNLYGKLVRFVPQLLFRHIPNSLDEVEFFLNSLTKLLGNDFLEPLLGQIFEDLKKEAPMLQATSLEDFKELFQTIDLPAIANTFQEDEVFAYMRVAGANPVIIEQMSSADKRLPITNEQYQEVMGSDDSLEAAMESGRLYLADYSILAGAINGTYTGFLHPHLQIQKYLYSPLALFAVPPGSDPNRMLQPVAIQCHSQPSPENPIITPKTGEYAWLIAKTVVQIADTNFHEAVSHLARTHLFVGPFAIATPRQLSNTHPLSLLLEPHFEGTLAINNAAQKSLISSGGGVDSLLSSSIDNSRVLAVIGLQTYSFNQAMLPKQLKSRGVDNTQQLPVYPYRDDALLIWDAIYQWVSAYLSLYYKSDEDIQQDQELQAWAKELTDFNGGRVIDFGEENGQIQTLKYLTEAATLIIFTASAQHAAVNFPQLGLMSYAPSMPTAGYLPVESLGSHTTEQDYLNLLPPRNQAQDQLNLLYLLGSTYFTELGQYENGHFNDPRVQTPLQTFKQKLEEIEATIEQRNLARPAYQYLLPSKIPQSINI
ncbi:MAG: lipoxygenase [Symploca sp. SIO2C1]|nr:lipoxygenase [Symploca sp. SIO2C1]